METLINVMMGLTCISFIVVVIAMAVAYFYSYKDKIKELERKINWLQVQNHHNWADGYQVSALRTINENLTEKEHIVNAFVGLATESSEALELVKKWAFMGHPLDKLKLGKELGDAQWYLAYAANRIGFSLSKIMTMNIDKLNQRYPQVFNTEDSIKRVDVK